MAKEKIHQRGALGKGLDVLFGGNTGTENPVIEKTSSSNGESILFLPVEQIQTNPYQPRKDFDETAMNELADSIRQKGVIQAITVRKLGENKFELISGERRLRASKIAGIEKIPAYVMSVEAKEDLLELALIENIQRENLNALEVAEGYQRLITECNLTQEKVSEKVGKSRTAVTNYLRMLKLPAEIQDSIRKGEVTEGHSRAILSLDDEVDQLLLWRKITGEKLSVRKSEEAAKTSRKPKQKKIYMVDDQNKSAIKFLEQKFMEHFGTRVKLQPTSKSTGHIVIEYFTAEDLERIIEMCKK